MEIKRVSPAEAKDLLDQGYIYIDVRSETEFAAGHPAGARNIPVKLLGLRGMVNNEEFLSVIEALYPKDTGIIVGCRSGQRSNQAARMLVAAGYTKIVDQYAGFEGNRSAYGTLMEDGWVAVGLPVATASPGGFYDDLRQKAELRRKAAKP